MGSKKAGEKTKNGCCIGFCIFLWKSLIVVSLVGTNFMALYSLTASQHLDGNLFSRAGSVHDVTSHIFGVHHELELAQMQLAGIRNDISAFLERLRDGKQHKPKKLEQAEAEMLPDNVNDDLNLLEAVPSAELQEFIAIRDLPLGKHHIFKVSKMASSIGHACSASNDLLQSFMDYDVGGMCPDDSDVAEKLLLRGCEPLPRRRCLARSPSNGSLAPLPFPTCLWTLPPDNAIVWTRYSCKSFSCLASSPVSGCDGCFDLEKESKRWVAARDDHDLLIQGVLRMKAGSIRIGLDLGGGSGSFAARMRQMNVVVVTTTLDADAPLSNLVAARGLVPMHVTASQRFPFFDNTLDLVHSMSLDLPAESLEFLLYDLDRILRPGGLLWLEKVSFNKSLFQEIYLPLIDKMGYERIKWFVDSADANQIRLTALLEKPVNREANTDSD